MPVLLFRGKRGRGAKQKSINELAIIFCWKMIHDYKVQHILMFRHKQIRFLLYWCRTDESLTLINQTYLQGRWKRHNENKSRKEKNKEEY